jgi:ferredoxin
MGKDVACIDDDKCIKCGVCHGVCPANAVRHDGERIPEEVQSNLAWARGLLAHEYYSSDMTKRKQLVERLQRLFSKNKKVAEKTLEQLESLQEPF